MADTPVRLVVFDCDGTLVDSQHHINAAMCTAFRVRGHPDPTLESVRAVVGLSLVEAVAGLLPGHAEEEHAAVAEAYRGAFFALRSRPTHHEPLFPGVAQALDVLAANGCMLGIATGKARRGLVATLGSHGLLDRFVTLQTADTAPGKPHPGMLLQAMAETGAELAQTVLVGDTTFDMLMARAAGVPGIGVGWGYHAADALRQAGAHRVIAAFAELPELVESLTRGEICA